MITRTTTESPERTTTTTEAPTTTTTTTEEPTTTTTTTEVRGQLTYCKFIFVPNSVDTEGFGLRYYNGQEIKTLFSGLFGTSTEYLGVSGVVYGVCSRITPEWWREEDNLNYQYPDGVLIIQNDEQLCSEEINCVYDDNNMFTAG